MMSVSRCVTLYIHDPSHSLFTISCHVCSILNGMSNIVVGSEYCIVHTILYCTALYCTVQVGSAPLAISSAWFPPEERVTATTIAQVFNGLGTGMSFLLASQLVSPTDNIVGAPPQSSYLK